MSKAFAKGAPAVVEDVDLTVGEGEFVVLLGPSGCGKTTTLRMIAGLEKLTTGELFFGDQLMNDVAPDRRNVGMVFQNYALYPHMTVRENLGFGLRSRSTSKAVTARRVGEVASLLELDDVLGRRPKELSGGQRQRVALGRALVRAPAAFLMDEPLSNLDANLREQTRMELTRLHARLGITTVYVTHDQGEAMTLADRVVVMEGGRIRQVGTPAEIYSSPADSFVARFIGTPGMNLWTLPWADNGNTITCGDALTLPRYLLPALASTPGRVTVGVRPEHLSFGRPEAGIAVKCRVELQEHLGSHVQVHAKLAGSASANQTLVARLDAGARFRPGDQVTLVTQADTVHLFDPMRGHRLLQGSGSDPIRDLTTTSALHHASALR